MFVVPGCVLFTCHSVPHRRIQLTTLRRRRWGRALPIDRATMTRIVIDVEIQLGFSEDGSGVRVLCSGGH